MGECVNMGVQPTAHGSSTLQTGEMEHFVVGDKPCTFVEVRDALSHCATAANLWSKLIEIARSLEIPADKIILLKTQTLTHLVTYPDALYDILETWRGKSAANAKLQTLVNVLETNGLNDCADTLRIRFRTFDDAYVVLKLKELDVRENLPDHLKDWMNKKSVEFQGKLVKLEKLTHQITNHVDRKIIDDLAVGKTPCIVNDNVPGHLDYYVHRTVRSRNILKTDVLKEICNDVFVIENIEKHQLSSLIPDNEFTDVSGNQLVHLTVRFILLQHKQDFEKIHKLAVKCYAPVHWVKYKNGSLELVVSSGSVKNLQKHVDHSQDSFFEDELASRPERVVVIADSPGMGKTCLLANIAHQITREQPTMLVRFIVLKEFVDALSKTKISIESIVKLISEQSSGYEFGRKFVEHALKNQVCILLFDGLDEVLPKQMTSAKHILRTVVALLPSSQVFVATRPHFRDEVENALHVLAYTIKPFDKSNQIMFLIKFWKMKGATANDSLTQFTNKCVQQLSSNMTISERNIAGIPLQCRLIAETYDEHAIRCSQLGYNVYEGAGSIVIANSMFGMYAKHMDMRFEKICNEESLVTRFFSKLTKGNNKYEIIKLSHMYFALELLFPEHAELFKNLNTSSIPLNELCGLGILEATQTNNIRFVHRTFAEFLVAWLAHENICSRSPHRDRDLLLSTIFKLTEDKLELKNPLQIMVPIPINSFQFDFPVICFFINGFAKKEITPSKLPINHNDEDEALPFYYASAYHNYENIPGIVTHSVARLNQTKTDDLSRCNLLYVAALYSGLELMKMFFTNITQINFLCAEVAISDNSETFIFTPLHVAVQRGHYSLVEYLLKKYDAHVKQLRYLIHFCVYDSVRNSSIIIEDKIQIIKLLSRRKKEWIDEELPYQTTPLMQLSVHSALLQYLIQESVNLNACDRYGNTVLHKIPGQNKFTGDSYHEIIRTLIGRGFQGIKKPNSDNITPFHRAVEHVELLNSTLEFFVSKDVDLNAVDDKGDSVLFYAIRGRRSVESIRKLINLGAEIEHRNSKGLNVLQISTKHRNLNTLKYFIEAHGCQVNINDRDEDRNTLLHLAVLNSFWFTENDNEAVQLFLINAGANVNAQNDLHKSPFMNSFEISERLSLTVIKEMEEHGLEITETVATYALTAAILECESEFASSSVPLDVIEYLIAKGGHFLFELSNNFWKWGPVQDHMSNIITRTYVSPKLLADAKQYGLLTQQQCLEFENLNNSLRSRRFYETVQEKPDSFERVYMILRADKQLPALQELKTCVRFAWEKLRDNIFITPHARLKQLTDSDNSSVVLLLTTSPELSVRRICDTINDKVKVLEENEFEQIVSINKSHKLVVLKCDTVTVELAKNLNSLKRKVVSVCRQAEDGVKGCEIVKDSQDWEDVSSKFIDKLWFRVDGSLHNATELFSAPSMIELMGKHAMEFHTLNDRFFFNVLDCKLGHPIKKRNNNYLSNKVFSHFLPDKLIFVNINEQDLRSYAKYGQKIGCVADGEALESLHYEYDYMILQQTDMILIEKIWKQVNSSVHLIEYVRGQFKVVRSCGSQENVKRFYKPTQFCSFPFCDCPTSYNMIVIIPFSYKLKEDEQLVTLELNLNELLLKGRRVFGFQDQIDFFELKRLVQGEKSIWALDFHSSTIKSQSKRYEHQIIRIVNQVVHDLSLGGHKKNMLKQVAVNTLFPKFANNIQSTYTGLEKYMRMGLLQWEYKNHSFMVFKHEVLAYYFITELIIEHQDFENFSYNDAFLTEVFLNCFETRLDQVTFNNQNNEKWFTKWIASYKFAHPRLFKFLDLFASKPGHTDALSKFLEKTISSESVFKWIHATVHDNLANLLKLIVKLEIDDNKIFESEDIVVLAVKTGDISLIQSVMQQYKKHTNKKLNDIKLPLFNQKYEFKYFITVLHVATMKSNFSVFEFLLNHHFKDSFSFNQPEMKNLLYFFVAKTHEHDEVDEQKRIITNFIQNYPFVIEEEASPLTAPNIHVDLILHLFNLGVNVRATDEHKQNILHLCAKYLTPKEYDRVVNALVEKRETEIFHLKDKRQCTPLHVAAEHLELLDSTINLFSSANVEFNAVNEENNTALIEAIFSYKSARVLDSLINAGADDQTPRRYNRGVINFAAGCSNFTALKYFILRGHDVNAMDEDNCTPLHLALQNSTTRTHNIVVSLVQHGANVNAIDKDGQTPLKIISVFEPFTRVENRTKEFLLKHGARIEMPGL